MNDEKNFGFCLKNLLTASGVSREDLACYLDVPVPVVNRWLNGVAAPDVYQFQAIARFFGMPYDWFLDDKNVFPSAEELAARLGLSKDTVEGLLALADDGQTEVLDYLDDAIYAMLSAVNVAQEGMEQRHEINQN